MGDSFCRQKFDFSCKFSYFFTRKQALTFHTIVSICMKCLILFSRENKKKYFNLSSTENITQHARRNSPLKEKKSKPSTHGFTASILDIKLTDRTGTCVQRSGKKNSSIVV